MRFPLAYYALLLYTSVIFKPLVITVEDMLSHTFAEAMHITTIHARYGNNHLQVQLASAEGSHSKTSGCLKAEDTSSFHLYAFFSETQAPPVLACMPYALTITQEICAALRCKKSPPPRCTALV